MRYLTPRFAVSALGRGAPVEQFFGPAFGFGRPGIRWVSIEPWRSGGFKVLLHLAWDVGGLDRSDISEFPPLDPDADETWQQIAELGDAAEAIRQAQHHTAAAPDRWVNFGVAAEEYRDYVTAGRLPYPVTEADVTTVVRRLMNGDGDERTASLWLDGLSRQTGCLHASDMIFWPDRDYSAADVARHILGCASLPLPGNGNHAR